MIYGSHAVLYSRDPEKVRTFLRDVLDLPAVDAGHGWLIFALPPAELAVHPGDEPATTCALYLLCDDLQATIATLTAKGGELARPVTDQRWGLVTALKLLDGGELGLYQPKHPTALGLSSAAASAAAMGRPASSST